MSHIDAEPDLVIRDARGVDGGAFDLLISGGRVAAIGDVCAPPTTREIDAHGGFVCPSFVDAHFHPDKALTFDRLGPIDQVSLVDSLRKGANLKRHFTSSDVSRRARQAAHAAVAQGTGAMRVHVDVDPDVGLLALDAVLALRRELAGYLELQVIAFPQQGVVRDSVCVELLRESLRRGADGVGGGPENEPSRDDWQPHVEQILTLAGEFGVTADVHVDMAEDPSLRNLSLVAETTKALNMQGRVNAIHCCAISSYSNEDAHVTIEQVAAAGVSVCICPIGNLLLTAEGSNPRGRGASRPKEMVAAGVNVALGSDNLSDVWFRFGSLDPMDLGMITCLAAGMKTDAEVREVFRMGTDGGARMMRLQNYGLSVGADANLVLFDAGNLTDAFRRSPAGRLTIRRGRIIGGVRQDLWVA